MPVSVKVALEENFIARRRISVVDLCMVLSGLGTELFSKELLPTNRNPVYSLHSRNFQEFVDDYITQLNRSYTPVNSINQDLIREETVRIYNQLSDSLGVHRPPHDHPRVKTMLFTPFISMVGVTGSMGPFFCEFTLNGDLLPANYPATYAHELAHLLGITSEAEANFYAYQVCTRSQAMGIRFSGYFSVLGHVLGNAKDYFQKKNMQNSFNASDRKLLN